MSNRGLRAIATAAAVLLWSFSGLQGQSSTFASVLVHGAGLTEPVLIDDPDVALCLWGFTYNFYSGRTDTQPGPGLPAVTLSFFTRDVWAQLLSNPTHSSEHVTPDRATFHTRIFLAPLGAEVLPHVQFKKPRDSTFVNRMTLLEAAEPFLAGYGIPTRVNAAGDPMVRQPSPRHIEVARAELRAMFGTRMPVCAAIPERG